MGVASCHDDERQRCVKGAMLFGQVREHNPARHILNVASAQAFLDRLLARMKRRVGLDWFIGHRDIASVKGTEMEC